MISLSKLRGKRKEINRIAAQYHAKNVRVFGSVSRGDNTENSDVDLLVSFLDGASLMDQVGLSNELSEALGIAVDVLSDRGINKHLEPIILKEAEYL